MIYYTPCAIDCLGKCRSAVRDSVLRTDPFARAGWSSRGPTQVRLGDIAAQGARLTQPKDATLLLVPVKRRCSNVLFFRRF